MIKNTDNSPTGLAIAALNGFKWLGNNLHNIKADPDLFAKFYASALEDAEKALLALTPVDPIAPGHNPDKLTVSQVGEGWRLLDEDEIHGRRSTRSIQSWDTLGDNAWDEETGSVGNYPPYTYRTRLSREALAALNAPKKPAWSMPVAPAGPGWHRNDFNEADLPPVTDGGLPWRPLLMGERRSGSDEIFERYDDRGWTIWNLEFSADNECPMGVGSLKSRTRRPLPSAPKLRAWNKPEDVPGPVCWLKLQTDLQNNFVSQILTVGDTGVRFINQTNHVEFLIWQNFARYKAAYSTDRKTWQPCGVTE